MSNEEDNGSVVAVVIYLIGSVFVAGGLGSLTNSSVGCIAFGTFLTGLALLAFLGERKK